MKFKSRQICSSKYDIDTSASGLSINIKVLNLALSYSENLLNNYEAFLNFFIAVVWSKFANEVILFFDIVLYGDSLLSFFTSSSDGGTNVTLRSGFLLALSSGVLIIDFCFTYYLLENCSFIPRLLYSSLPLLLGG